MEVSTNRLRSACLHIVIGGFLFSYNLSVLNTSIENISYSMNWGSNKKLYFILSNTLMPVGTLIGGMMTGCYSTAYGRRSTIIFSDILTIAGTLLSIVPFGESFLVARLVLGIASGVFLTISPVFISEITPNEYISNYGPYVQISTDVGVLVSYLICLPLPTSDYSSWLNNWWVFMMVFPGFISAYQLWYFSYIFVYDSPTWLSAKGKKNEASNVIKYLFYDNLDKLENNNEFFTENTEAIQNTQNEGYFDLFFKRENRKLLFIAASLAIIQQLSGINPAIIYSSYIFQELGGSVFKARIYTVISGLVFVISSLSSIFFLKYFGRKTLILFGEVAIFFINFGIGLCVALDLNLLYSVVLINVFYVFYTFTLGGALWTYLGETLNEKLMSVSTSVNFLFVCIICFTFPIVSEYLGMAYYFFLFSGSMVVSWVICSRTLVETKGRTKEEVKNLMKSYS